MHFVGDEGGLVDEDEGGGGVAADDAAAVGEDGGCGVDAVSFAEFAGEQERETAEEAQHFGGLVERGGGEEDLGVGAGPGEVEGFDGGDPGFAPLAGAADDEAVGVVVEDFSLDGVGLEVEDAGSPRGDGLRRGLGGSGWRIWTRFGL